MLKNAFITLAVLLLAASAMAQGKPDPGLERSMWYPDPGEVMALPRYCHGQFIKELQTSPGAVITNCGGGMNHFCPAIVITNRLQRYVTAPKQQRITKVREALHEIEYTKQRMTPDCPIRGDVALVESRLRMYEQLWK